MRQLALQAKNIAAFCLWWREITPVLSSCQLADKNACDD